MNERDRDLSIDIYGTSAYAYYLSDFSRTERAKLWFIRNRNFLRCAAVGLTTCAVGTSLAFLFA